MSSSIAALRCADIRIKSVEQAEVAQLVEQLIRNQQVVGSTPIFGSIPNSSNEEFLPQHVNVCLAFSLGFPRVPHSARSPSSLCIGFSRIARYKRKSCPTPSTPNKILKS
jgi:hypothetical protein